MKEMLFAWIDERQDEWFDMMYDLICDPELVKKAKEEWKQTG